MESIVIKNFKSYEVLSLRDLHPNINVIIGGNGQGKSNFFKAISFVLFDKHSLNHTQFNSYIHRGLNETTENSIEAEIKIREKIHFGKQYEKIVFRKLWKQDSEEQHYLNNKKHTKKQYQNLVETIGLTSANPYNIVQQGKIIEVTLMDDHQLYKLLKQVSGVQRYIKKREEVATNLKKAKIEKEEAQMSIEELEKNFRTYEVKLEEFEFYNVEEKAKKFKQKKSFSEMLQTLMRNISSTKEEYFSRTKALEELIEKRKSFQDECLQNQMNLKILTDKIKFYEGTKIQPGSSEVYNGTQEVEENLRKLNGIQRQMREISKQMTEKDRQIQDFRREFSILERKYQGIKMKNKVEEKISTEEKIIKGVEEQIVTEKQNIKKMGERERKVKEEMKTLSKKTPEVKCLQNYDQLKSEISEIAQQLKTNKNQINLGNWEKNNLLLQTESSKQILQKYHTKLRKALPLIDLNFLDQLRKMRIKGVYGYLIEFLDIHPNVSFAYEMTGVNRLCSLLVEDEAASTAVIEINRKSKGRKINLLQLNYFRSRPFGKKIKPKEKEAESLFNEKWIKVANPDHIQVPDSFSNDVNKILSNTFNNFSLVRSYESGLEISKKYSLNCITPEKQVIYAEGYLCKLGRDEINHESKLQVFRKCKEKKCLLEEKQEKLSNIQKTLGELQNLEISLMNALNEKELKEKGMRETVSDLKRNQKIMESFEEELVKIKKDTEKSKQTIQQKEELIKNFKKSGKKKISQTEAKNTEAEYIQKRKFLNNLLNEAFLIEERLQSLANDEKVVQKKIEDQRKIQPQPDNYSDMKSGLLLENLQKQAERVHQRLNETRLEIEKMQEGEKLIGEEKASLQTRILANQQQQKDLKSKLKELMNVPDEIDDPEVSHSMSISMSMSLDRRVKHHFSAKDKLFFSKFKTTVESLNEIKKNLSQFIKTEERYENLLKKYDDDCEEIMRETEQRFTEEFQRIFKQIVSNGTCEVKFKSQADKIKNKMVTKRCLSINLSFNSDPFMKKWSAFSGGQKTLIAICIIMSLQKCEPAPFYIFDEIDAALDSKYVKKIADLILNESHQNDCQYLITSFKEDMLQFSEDYCNYYEVSCENRKSGIVKVSQNTALQHLSGFSGEGRNMEHTF